MSCESTQPQLVAYHFGVVDSESREELEAHLLSCPDCLSDYLAIKRDIETTEDDPQPSPAARQRLRQAVAEELGIGKRRARWSWWERPLAFGFAGAAVALALLLLSVIASTTGSMPHSMRNGTAEHPSPTRAR